MKNNNLQTPEVIDLVIANIITDEERKNWQASGYKKLMELEDNNLINKN
jgi:hypothetical protein